MADKKKKSKNRRDEDLDKPSKEECAVAKHLKFGLESREARLVGMTVKYFIASEAVDKLLASKWATQKNKQDNLFTTRQQCVNYLDRLLNKGMFHRALKAEKKKKEEVKGGKKKEAELEESQDDKKLRRRKKGKKEEVEEKGSEKEEREETEKEDKKDEKTDDKKKKEKKLKLKMHDDQVFVDGDQVYVWIYDPVNIKTFIIGLLMVLGTIGLCLFPLWPPIVRQGVYYCSLGGAVFVGCILALAVIRFILFCLIWLFTGGKHHFWFLPNLTEDVGFFDSFKPLYTHSYKGNDASAKDSKTKKNERTTQEKTEKTETHEEKTEKCEELEEKAKKSDESEKSESSDNDGYEIVDKSEVTEEDQE